MIEVIGQDDSVQKRNTCSNCGAIISYYQVDVKEKMHVDYSGTSDVYRWIECPNCKERVYVK